MRPHHTTPHVCDLPSGTRIIKNLSEHFDCKESRVQFKQNVNFFSKVTQKKVPLDKPKRRHRAKCLPGEAVMKMLGF